MILYTIRKKRNSIVKIVESITGTWFYHLALDDSPYKALCGAQTMITLIPLSYWNKTPNGYHIHEKWCKKCEELHGLPQI